MEIIKVETTTIVFDADELEMLRTLVQRGAMNCELDKFINEDDLKEFAEYFTTTTNDL